MLLMENKSMVSTNKEAIEDILTTEYRIKSLLSKNQIEKFLI